MGNGWNTPGEPMTDLVPPKVARTGRVYDGALGGLLTIAAFTLLACAPAVVIIVWRWAL